MVQSSDGGIWITSNKGVTRFLHDSFITNNKYEGLFDSRVNFVLQESPQRFSAGGEMGLCIYETYIDVDPPETDFPQINNTADFNNNSKIQFTLHGIDRWEQILQDRLLYSYKLNQGEWSLLQSDNLIHFDDLPTGAHTLFAHAVDRNEIWIRHRLRLLDNLREFIMTFHLRENE